MITPGTGLLADSSKNNIFQRTLIIEVTAGWNVFMVKSWMCYIFYWTNWARLLIYYCTIFFILFKCQKLVILIHFFYIIGYIQNNIQHTHHMKSAGTTKYVNKKCKTKPGTTPGRGQQLPCEVEHHPVLRQSTNMESHLIEFLKDVKWNVSPYKYDIMHSDEEL